MDLNGRTIFITGASRGIGKAIALRAARDGANIAIASKTAEPHPKLPGTIYTAAEEVEAAGGKALPLVVDVRDHERVAQAVQETAEHFGGIDICINNASAIQLTGTADTPMKRFDLMFTVNVRGTYVTSQACLPYLLKSEHAKILNMSPPLNMDVKWFQNHVAYTMSKYGMSMCAHGMAAEFAGKIAVNALWPKTAIATAAIDMLGGEAMRNASRKPEIMADAAHWILSQGADCTGNFFIDEDVLREAGVTDFEPYAVVPGGPLMPDFFL
ncbi:MAG: NAD(P)-dependent oxidoreductase [Myxococcales bacterium]|nr:NAD(P)-dependent oxidoreductase [Myxococcales bacterium]